MSPASPPLLSVEGLRVDYGRGPAAVRAVDGVDLELREGETLGVVGESGAGKSSTLLAVPRLLPRGARVHPDARVRLRGRDLTRADPGELRELRGREMGLIFQQPGASLNPVHRAGRAVAEAVREGRGLDGAELEREVLRLLERAGLGEPERAARAYPHQLSGGMQQRVALAAAVGGEPSVLLADEPTAALDVVVEAEVLERLARMQRAAGVGMILVSHDLRVVAGVADRVAVMRDGRVVERGEAARILAEPEHPYTRELMEAAPRLPEEGGGSRGGRDRVRVSAPRPEEPAEPAAAGGEGGADAEPPLLEARDVGRRYGGGGWLRRGTPVRALDGLSLTLRPGEAVGLVGASGAGKSTAARVLTGAEAPDRGELAWRGRKVDAMGRRERSDFRRSAQLLHQDPFASLNPRMSVGEAIGEPIEVHGLAGEAGAGERVRRLLERVGLPPGFRERLPGELSGGERQRVALARALAVRPDLLAADEPVSALDVSVQARVLELLRGLRADLDLTLLLVAHDLAVVAEVCDRVVVLHRGRVVESGPTGRVLLRPEHRRTRELVEAAAFRAETVP